MDVARPASDHRSGRGARSPRGRRSRTEALPPPADRTLLLAVPLADRR